jgi:hypothetical protein
MKGYRARWEIDVEAPDPTTAAREAWTIQHRPDSIATFFEVVEHDGGYPPDWDHAVEIDVLEEG